jgi:deoxycytidylate deaminase
MIIMSGIKEVFYAESYRDLSPLDLLRSEGVKVTQIKEELFNESK